MEKPSSECDTICLVVELLRINLVEVVQLRILEDLCVKVCNTVYTVAIVYINVCHVHSLILVDDIYALILVSVTNLLIQFLDDRNKLWNNLLKVSKRPLLKSLCKDSMVGVCAHLCHDLCSLVKWDALSGKKSDELRDHHWRMCIIDLNCCIISQIVKIWTLCLSLIKNELCTICHHEILLVDTEKISSLIAVVRVQAECQVLCNVCLVEVNSARLHDGLVNALDIEEVELICSVLVSGYIYIVHSWLDFQIAKCDRVGNVCLLEPAVCLNPRICSLLLVIVLKYLLEQTHVVIKSNSISVKSEGCHGVEEACCKSSKTTISKWWLRLNLLYVIDALAILSKHLFNLVKYTKVDEIVREKLSYEELCWDVINLLLSLLWNLSVCELLCHIKECEVDLLVCAVLDLLVVFLHANVL